MDAAPQSRYGYLKFKLLHSNSFCASSASHFLSRPRVSLSQEAAPATSLADGNCTIELEQRIDTKSQTQEDTNKGILTKAHLHQISSQDSPETNLQACSDLTLIARRSVFIKASAMLHNRSQSNVHSRCWMGTCCTCCTSSKKLNSQVPNLLHFFRPLKHMHHTCCTLSKQLQKMFQVHCKLFKKFKKSTPESAIRRVSSNCFGDDNNFNGGSVWTRCWRRGLSLQRRASNRNVSILLFVKVITANETRTAWETHDLGPRTPITFEDKAAANDI